MKIQQSEIKSLSELFKFLAGKRKKIGELLKHGCDLTEEDIMAANARDLYYGKAGVIRNKGLVTIMTSKNRYADQLKLFADRILRYHAQHEEIKGKNIKIQMEKIDENCFYQITFLGSKIASYDCEHPIVEYDPSTSEYSVVEYQKLKAGEEYVDDYSSVTMEVCEGDIVEIVIEHASNSSFLDIFAYLDKLAEPLFSDKKTGPDKVYDILAEIQWYLSQTAFCELGSASTNILVDRALTMFLGLPLYDYKPGAPIDLEAISTTCNEFVESYRSLFQLPPSATLLTHISSMYAKPEPTEIDNITNPEAVDGKSGPVCVPCMI